MKEPLIELIVQAVKAEFQKEFYEKEQVFWPSQIESLIRTALASIPEMPQVDLGEVEKLVCITANEVDAEHDEIYKAVWRNAISDFFSIPHVSFIYLNRATITNTLHYR